MKMTDLFLSELEREVRRSRHALEQVPEGKHDWKPHDKSMIFGYLAQMVATIPTWIAMIVKQDELDIAPKGGPTQKPAAKNTSAEYLEALDKAAADARAALSGTTDEHLKTLMAPAGRRSACHGAAAARDDPRHHQSLGPPPRSDDRVPAADGREGAGAYGPSADDKSFG